MRSIAFLSFLSILLLACNPSTSQTAGQQAEMTDTSSERPEEPAPDYSAYKTPSLEEAGLTDALSEYESAFFASGCFWCTEEVFQRVRGVQAVYSGYVGGTDPHPTYYEVGNGTTDYAEAVVVYYDPEVVSYDLLLEFFYASHDPTQVDRQGPDAGPQYRSGVFYLNEEQAAAARTYQQKLEDSDKYSKPIATEITAAGTFYLAEDYHQDYYPNNPQNPYVQRVSKPKVEKFSRAYQAYLY